MRAFFADPHEVDSLEQDLGEWDNILISFYPHKDQKPYIKFTEVDPQALFDHLKHGDEKHQEWLKTEIFKYFDTGSEPAEKK